MRQPRRVAARASAARIAEENGWELGREVGYHVRFDRKIGRETRLRVLAEGVLNREVGGGGGGVWGSQGGLDGRTGGRRGLGGLPGGFWTRRFWEDPSLGGVGG